MRTNENMVSEPDVAVGTGVNLVQALTQISHGGEGSSVFLVTSLSLIQRPKYLN